MIAAGDRCSCPECGVVCFGKFVGCSTVWAAGPKAVTLRRPTREPSAPKALPGPAANGSGSPTHAMPALAAAPLSFSPAEAGDDLRPLLHALRAEMQVLSRKVDQIQGPAQSGEEAAQTADRALAATEALPGRIAKAVAGALREQHQAILVDLGVLRVQLAADGEAVREALHHPAESGLIVDAIDARFAWLVDELSARFVTMGNEVARMDRCLAALIAEHGAAPTVPAQTGEALAPLLAEVERLTQAIESWRPGTLAGMRRR